MPLRHNVKEVELKNGAKGLIVDVPDASVFCYDFNFRAGNKYVKDPSIQQTAHLLEHLAFVFYSIVWRLGHFNAVKSESH